MNRSLRHEQLALILRRQLKTAPMNTAPSTQSHKRMPKPQKVIHLFILFFFSFFFSHPKGARHFSPSLRIRSVQLQ
jgi:hypothetical protein